VWGTHKVEREGGESDPVERKTVGRKGRHPPDPGMVKVDGITERGKRLVQVTLP